MVYNNQNKRPIMKINVINTENFVLCLGLMNKNKSPKVFLTDNTELKRKAYKVSHIYIYGVVKETAQNLKALQNTYFSRGNQDCNHSFQKTYRIY